MCALTDPGMENFTRPASCVTAMPPGHWCKTMLSPAATNEKHSVSAQYNVCIRYSARLSSLSQHLSTWVVPQLYPDLMGQLLFWQRYYCNIMPGKHYYNESQNSLQLKPCTNCCVRSCVVFLFQWVITYLFNFYSPHSSSCGDAYQFLFSEDRAAFTARSAWFHHAEHPDRWRGLENTFYAAIKAGITSNKDTTHHRHCEMSGRPPEGVFSPEQYI